MIKEEVELFLDKFIEIDCLRDVYKNGKDTWYFNACGYIKEIHTDLLIFEDNEGNRYRVKYENVLGIIDMGQRRTMKEWKEEQAKVEEREAKKREKKMGRVE